MDNKRDGQWCIKYMYNYCKLSNFLKYWVAFPYIKKYMYDIKEQLSKFIAKHVAQILGQNFR